MLSLHSLDISGTILCFFATLLYVRASLLCWPVGLLATINDGILYGLSGIYGDMVLQVIYFISMFYGWYQWRRGGLSHGHGHGQLAITHLSRRVALRLTLILLLGMLLVSQYLLRYTDSQVPYLDAITLVISLGAQWLTCKKIIESWFLWFLVDLIYVALYLYKGIPFHAGLNLLYLGMAMSGYWYWNRLMKEKKKSTGLTPALLSAQ